MPTIKLDTVAAAAVDLARAAAEEAAGPGGVGEHLGAAAEGERVVAHRFAAIDRAYPGWEWTVVLARVPRARAATVSEVVLLPGGGSLLAPEWVPWSQRIAPGDLGESDLLPYREDDPLLDPGYEQAGGSDAARGDEAFDDLDVHLLTEIGFGRARVVNREGRAEAAARWIRGAAGPDAPSARAAAASCSTCGYLVGLAGSLRTVVGVCANAWSPDDGRVVAMDHGCGAHSETGVDEAGEAPLPELLVDQVREELDVEPVDGPVDDPVVEPVDDPVVELPGEDPETVDDPAGPVAEVEPVVDPEPLPEPLAGARAEPVSGFVFPETGMPGVELPIPEAPGAGEVPEVPGPADDR